MKAAQKYQLLIAGILLLALLSYQFGLKKTIQTYRQIKVAKQQLQTAREAPARIKHMQAQIDKIGAELPKQQFDREDLFGEVQRLCRTHQLQLILFAPEVERLHSQQTVLTNEIVVQGNYLQMLQFAYALENTHQLGFLSSADFSRTEDRYKKRTYLQGTFYLQNLQL